MRALAAAVIALAACRPSATVETTTPIANLRAHHTALVRVRSSAFASQGRAMFLEQAVATRLRERCGFVRVDGPNAGTADLVIDLNLTQVGAGGGWTGNGQASLEALLVITDGGSGDLLGTSRVRGQAHGSLLGGGRPENEAIDAMAKSIASVLVKSGCAGPRLAREAPPPPPDVTTTTDGATIDPAQREQAEALNEQGKERIRGGDAAGALVAFQQAEALVPDPKYVLNICLTYEATEQWPQAIQACERARGMNPDERLSAKIEQRLEILAVRRR